MSLKSIQFRKIAVAAAKSAVQKKGGDVLLLDLRKSPYSGLTDFLLILSANSSVHLKALRDAIEEKVEEMGLNAIHKEGMGSAQWTVLDYGGLMVHIFQEESRSFYSLERLWEKAKKVKVPRD